MWNTSNRPAFDAERESAEKARRRAEQAAIVDGLQKLLEGDEQLLAFARGRIAGGWRGKLTLGPEAFFAPDINIGLTERRLILQHVHLQSGTPSEIEPHLFALGDLQAIRYDEIETFGGEQEGRLTVQKQEEHPTRIRLIGKENCGNAQAIVEVFQSLTTLRQPAPHGPTRRLCLACNSILDQPVRFCPFCGARQEESASAEPAPVPAEMPPVEASPVEAAAMDSAPVEIAPILDVPPVVDTEFAAPEMVVEDVLPLSEPAPESLEEPEEISPQGTSFLLPDFTPAQEAAPAPAAAFDPPQITPTPEPEPIPEPFAIAENEIQEAGKAGVEVGDESSSEILPPLVTPAEIPYYTSWEAWANRPQEGTNA
jgi:hypothetical protein